MKNLLKGEELPDEEAFLGLDERLVLYSILSKKYKNVIKACINSDASIDNIVKQKKQNVGKIECLLHKCKSKRKEENLKFVFR